MVEIEVGRGDSAEARSLVAAMEAWVNEGWGPMTPDRTSTVSADDASDLGCRRARLDTALPMTTAMAMYRSAGYRSIPDCNGNSYASFWGEKEL